MKPSISISAKHRTRLRLLASARGIPVSQLIDEALEREHIQTVVDRIVSEGIDQKQPAQMQAEEI